MLPSLRMYMCEEREGPKEGQCSLPSFPSSEAALQSLHSSVFSSGTEYVSFPEDVASSTAALQQTLEQVEVRMRGVVHARDKKKKVRNVGAFC